jgi:hypothetical protein
MSPDDNTTLPVVRAAELARVEDHIHWLIEQLWSVSAVGIVGGPPKSCKTWLALDMAVSLASATPCLGAFNTQGRGRVLLYAAEDSQAVLKQRLEAICRNRGLSLGDLEIYVITTDRLRLDLATDQKRLAETLRRLKPHLLLLDPLVRLHRINENDAGEVSALLDYLRTLQRQHHVAVALVHHTRKNNSTGHPGQALRGSSDLHAWSDCSLYLRRKNEQLLLLAEHRAAPSPQPVELKLVDGNHPHLEALGPVVKPPGDLCEAILRRLEGSQQPLSRTALREQLRTRNERLGQALALLERRQLIQRTPSGWCIAAANPEKAGRSRSALKGSSGTEQLELASPPAVRRPAAPTEGGQ